MRQGRKNPDFFIGRKVGNSQGFFILPGKPEDLLPFEQKFPVQQGTGLSSPITVYLNDLIRRIMRQLAFLFPTFVLLFLLTGACGSSKKLEKPSEYYEEVGEYPVSKVHIPVRINIREVEQSLNRQLDGVIFEDNDLHDGDRMMLRAVKKERLQLTIDSQQIRYALPLLLWIKYDAGITDVEASGEIILDMSTSFRVTPDWRILTETELEGHQWVREPKLRLGAMSVSVGGVLDLILRNGSDYLTDNIDQQVSKSLNLEEIILDVWRQMNEPMLVSQEYNTWLTVNPVRLAMTPLHSEQKQAASTILIEARPYIKLGVRPVSQALPALPPLEFVSEADDDIFLLVDTEVTYLEAERIAKSQLVGETFESGNRSVTVEDIEIYGSGDHLVVNTSLSGSYNGSVFLEGVPAYNPRRNTVEIKDLQFTLSTANFLHKSAGWLLKSTIKRKIQENMSFLLDYNLDDMKEELQHQIDSYPLSEGLVLNGTIDDLGILDVFLTEKAIRVAIGLTGQVAIDVNGLK